MKDRRSLMDDGMITIALALDSKTNTVIVPPVFVAQGVINADKEKVINECSALVMQAIKEKLISRTNYAEIKNIIKVVAGDYIYRKTLRTPMVIPVIMAKN